MANDQIRYGLYQGALTCAQILLSGDNNSTTTSNTAITVSSVVFGFLLDGITLQSPNASGKAPGYYKFYATRESALPMETSVRYEW